MSEDYEFYLASPRLTSSIIQYAPTPAIVFSLTSLVVERISGEAHGSCLQIRYYLITVLLRIKSLQLTQVPVNCVFTVNLYAVVIFA